MIEPVGYTYDLQKFAATILILTAVPELEHPGILYQKKTGLGRKPDFVHIFVDLKKNTKVTPTLLQSGRQPKGSLTPICNLVDFMKCNRNVGGKPKRRGRR
jgi:hypothetical protein